MIYVLAGLFLAIVFCLGGAIGDHFATKRCARERETDEAIARAVRRQYPRTDSHMPFIAPRPEIVVYNASWRERPSS